MFLLWGAGPAGSATDEIGRGRQIPMGGKSVF
jgi:hypothetical protein